jgi:16S rRNA (cytosine1402-N4)-methyltransferase
MSELNEPGDRAPPRHVPVMLREVIEFAAPQPGQVIVDATLGAGGHASEIARMIGPEGLMIGLDCDPAMIEIARSRIVGSRIELVEANFAELRGVLNELGVDRVDAVLMDLGVASDQIEDSARGFSFSRSGPLDMRMNPRVGEPAARLVNRLKAENLADIFYQYGEERHSRRVARAIVEARRRKEIETTDELAEIVRRAMPRSKPWQRIDPATRVFQALRIAVNDELLSLEQALAALPACVKPGGRAVVISFHSLEDRLVKQAFRQRETWERLTKKPLVPSEEEIERNPRSRSAKLRAAKLRSQNLTIVERLNR